MTRKNLQIAMAILACVPFLTGLIGMTGIDDPIYPVLPRDATLDSNLRFYGGVWCGLGLAAFWLIPRIEKETALFRFIWGSIFIGGIGRVLSLFLVGMPFVPMVGFTVLEIIGSPFFIWWQSRIAGEAKERGQGVR